MHTLPTQDAFARTYEGGIYADPTEAVADYRQYQREWANSELGSHAISTRMELPRGRIRTWEEGGRPDVVRGVDTAREHGWLECLIDSDTFVALNRLVSGVFSGGSISKLFVPNFSAPEIEVENQLRADLDSLGVGCQVVYSNSGNVEELRPKQDASVLGRLLVALGAPQGPKAETVDTLPSYLDKAPESIRRDFVRIYVSNRAAEHRGKDLLQIQEERSRSYLTELEALFDSVLEAEVWGFDRGIRFRKSALDELSLSR